MGFLIRAPTHRNFVLLISITLLKITINEFQDIRNILENYD